MIKWIVPTMRQALHKENPPNSHSFCVSLITHSITKAFLKRTFGHFLPPFSIGFDQLLIIFAATQKKPLFRNKSCLQSGHFQKRK